MADPVDPALIRALERFADTAAPARAEAVAEGLLRLSAGDPARAEPLLADAQSDTERLALGVSRVRLGRYAEAEAPLRALLRQRSPAIGPFIWLGLALLGQGRAEEALDLYAAALDLHADNLQIPRIYADAAVALDQLGRYRDGAALCEEGLARWGQPVLAMNLAAFRLRLGEPAAAREALGQALRLDPGRLGEVRQIWAQWGDGTPWERP